jgi:hypothetical protein
VGSSQEPPPLQVVASPAPPPGSVACEGLFAKDTDHGRVLAAFGAANVAFAETHTGVGDITEMATVLYPQDPARRLDDEELRWSAGHGLRMGLNVW